MHSEDLPTQSRRKFCLALKAARERNGISLAKIAETTKIPASLFEALECSDLRRWPKGLFRRSFFRDYVRAIGLPMAETVDEFVRLFPDHGAKSTGTAAAADEAEPAEDIRLVFDESWHGPRASVLARLLAALIDGSVIILAAAAIAWAAGMDQSATIATVALAYFSVATALLGESPAKWILSRRHELLETLTPARAAFATAWKSGAALISQGFASAEEETPEPASRLRVRIKVPQ